jgi:hypothetical protein
MKSPYPVPKEISGSFEIPGFFIFLSGSPKEGDNDSGILLFSVLCTGIHHTRVVKYVLQFVIYTFAYVPCN